MVNAKSNVIIGATIMVMVGTLLLLLFVGCATVKSDWEQAQLQNTGTAYGTFLTNHPQSEFSTEANRRFKNISLAETVMQMAPSTEIQVDINRAVIPTHWDAESSQNQFLPRLEKLLAEGADPNALKIAGYCPASTSTETRVENGFTQVTNSTKMGSRGFLVQADGEGQTLLEYCQALKLLRVANLLIQHGAK